MSTPLIVSISSMALFNLEQCHAIYQEQGIEAYAKYQIDHENDVLEPGVAFTLIQKLLNLNQDTHRIEVCLVSRNSADTSLRIFNSIEHYQLPITKAGFTNGTAPGPYLNAFGSHLFLSENTKDIREALQANFAAARVLTNPNNTQKSHQELRIAFDGDAVLFSDESERIYQDQGLEAFLTHEKNLAKQALTEGPFKAFLSAVHQIQQDTPNDQPCPIRTALVTARCAPAHERVIQTLRAWGIRIDEAFFLGGLNKSDFLTAFQADIFFDDQQHHCEKAKNHVTTAHVPHGVMNEINE
jgi:5'-nucleotidase